MRFFYGWWLVGFAWILYGFGAAPGYYSWSFFSPEIIDELDLTRAQTGAVFGLFTFMFNSIAPVTGLAIARWGTRRVMVVGNLFTAPGCWLLSGAGSLWECLVYFGILVGAGIGLSTIVPCQAPATSWFTKYRARAVAAVLTAGGMAGVLVTWFDRVMVQEYSWRTGWQIIAVLSLARTATNIKCGGMTPLAGILKCWLKLAMAFFLAAYLDLVPMACIAGILAYVALNMVKWDEIKQVHKMNRFHIFLMYQTAVVVLLKDFLSGVLLAIILYALLNRFFDKPESPETAQPEASTT